MTTFFNPDNIVLVMGEEEGVAGEDQESSDKNQVDERKWVGIRLSKVMMSQVEEAVKAHPEWAWSSNNDFVRDAVRRLLEHVRKQDVAKRQNIVSMPKKILDAARGILDDESYEQFRKRFLDLLSTIDFDKEPVEFLDSSTGILASYLGEGLARKVIGGLYDEVG